MSNSVLSGLLAMSFGLLVFLFALVIVMYVLWSLAVFKVLKKLGSDWAWMAWIPVLSSIALAREADDGTGNVDMFGQKIPVNIFMFWSVANLLIAMIPGAGGILSRIFSTICGGLVYRSVYARCEGRTESEMLALGLVSGFLPIIALVKFLSYKKD